MQTKRPILLALRTIHLRNYDHTLKDSQSKSYVLYFKVSDLCIKPQFCQPVTYRPIRVYVGGEVKRQGYYTLQLFKNFEDFTNNANKLVDSTLRVVKRGLQHHHLQTAIQMQCQYSFLRFLMLSAQPGITPYQSSSG